MKGRDGDYSTEEGVHLTRVFSRREYRTLEDWAAHVLILGVQPDIIELSEVTRDGLVALSVDGKAVRYPEAVCVCTCRWSRPAPSRIMARSSAFVHKQLARMSGCDT